MPRISIEDQRFPVGLFGPMGFFFTTDCFFVCFFCNGRRIIPLEFSFCFRLHYFSFYFLVFCFWLLSVCRLVLFMEIFFLVICH